MRSLLTTFCTLVCLANVSPLSAVYGFHPHHKVKGHGVSSYYGTTGVGFGFYPSTGFGTYTSLGMPYMSTYAVPSGSFGCAGSSQGTGMMMVPYFQASPGCAGSYQTPVAPTGCMGGSFNYGSPPSNPEFGFPDITRIKNLIDLYRKLKDLIRPDDLPPIGPDGDVEQRLNSIQKELAIIKKDIKSLLKQKNGDLLNPDEIEELLKKSKKPKKPDNDPFGAPPPTFKPPVAPPIGYGESADLWEAWELTKKAAHAAKAAGKAYHNAAELHEMRKEILAEMHNKLKNLNKETGVK